MTKSELIAELANANPHLRGSDVELIVSTIFEQITAALARASIDLEDRRLYPKGGFRHRANGRELYVRVSARATPHGPAAVLRL